MWIITLFGALLWTSVCALVPPCCEYATGACRLACDETSLIKIALDHNERLHFGAFISESCPIALTKFWICMNDTFENINRGDGWYGRPCCSKPVSKKCQLACLRSQSQADLQPSCRQSDEIAFYSCLEKQELGKRCCENAQTPECYLACKNVFINSPSPSRQIRETVASTCGAHSPAVLQCIQNITHLTHSENAHKKIHCCDHASSDRCRTTCHHVLRTVKIEQEIMDGLTESCGPPRLQEKLWQCFLYSSKPTVPEVQKNVLPVDAAKLQCCFRAATMKCQRLCLKTYGTEWESAWSEFHNSCQYDPSEIEMQSCLAEVEEPCELGCKTLDYCTNFNNRPTELFHSCNRRSDLAAEKDVKIWSQGVINLPLMSIPVKDISSCYPDVWKAIACTLQLKPCHRYDHRSVICKEDCIDILSKCVDRSKLEPYQTPETLCESLAPPGTNPSCISLKPYLKTSKFERNRAEITNPCWNKSCNSSSVCVVDRKCSGDYPCSDYKCIPGCILGEGSHTVVAQGSHVRIPTLVQNRQCYTVCYCSSMGVLENCIPQPCTDTEEPCFYKNSKYAHNTRFTVDCNECFCDSGNVTCSPGTCSLGRKSGISREKAKPSHCLNDYYPVCGSNGKTYPNSCFAKNAGLLATRYRMGSCYDLDPCSPNPCSHGERCIPYKKVCLSKDEFVCKQYICVNANSNCHLETPSAVCDKDNNEHYNLCSLVRKGKSLSYLGHCKQRCRRIGQVCGMDGETYDSECEAQAKRILVDYDGPCFAVATTEAVTVEDTRSFCHNVRCPFMPSKSCIQITLKGACCPVCGTAMEVSFSETLASLAAKSANSEEPVKVHNIIEKLREKVMTAECDLYGHLGLNSNLVIVVIPITKYPTELQVEVCRKELQKLETLIKFRSPRLLSDLALSSFTMAAELEPELYASSASMLSCCFALPVLLTLYLFSYSIL